ncbi:hypothetical protein EMIT0P395_70095 [Pseudomonas sp. IT-P395]
MNAKHNQFFDDWIDFNYLYEISLSHGPASLFYPSHRHLSFAIIPFRFLREGL